MMKNRKYILHQWFKKSTELHRHHFISSVIMMDDLLCLQSKMDLGLMIRDSSVNFQNIRFEFQNVYIFFTIRRISNTFSSFRLVAIGPGIFAVWSRCSSFFPLMMNAIKICWLIFGLKLIFNFGLELNLQLCSGFRNGSYFMLTSNGLNLR